MPEVRFRIRWPDGAVEECYSPSSIVTEYLASGADYTVADFMGRARSALHQASRRVEQIYGRPCGLALGQIAQLENHYKTAGFPDTAIISCLDMTPSSLQLKRTHP